MKKLLLLFIAAVCIAPAFAQETGEVKRSRKEERKLRISAIIKQEEEGVIKYKKHTAAGVKLTNDGYGIFVEVARAQSVKKALLFQLDIAERKHPKETKLQGADIYGSTVNPLIYGKVNYFYPVKLGVQKQYLLGNKGNKNGTAITLNAGGGISLALLRPYMVDVLDADSSRNHRYITYDPNDTTFAFLDFNRILSGPDLATGWNKLKMTPGLYAKTGVRFDFGKYNEMVTAIEVGVSAEYYFKKIPQMAFNSERQFFFNGYVSFIFGKRK
ncbi:MAG: hypothetical protein JST81_15555 [Bacteroidetes bacterium]|nr:hypothetical protein [Bacteroidota bacterium]